MKVTMMEFLSILLPIFGMLTIGFIGQKIGFDTKTISTMALYLMSPVLVFRTFYTFALCFALIIIVYII
jgi:predicted permease